MKTMTLEDHHAALRAQGGDRLDAKVVCPICGTPQSARDLIQAGAGADYDDVMKYWGFSCVGRFTGAGSFDPRSKRKGANNKPGRGCDWTLGGLLRLHTLEVIGPDGKHYPRFEPLAVTADAA